MSEKMDQYIRRQEILDHLDVSIKYFKQQQQDLIEMRHEINKEIAKTMLIIKKHEDFWDKLMEEDDGN